MATTYITDADLQTTVATRLGTTWALLVASAAHWEDIVADANQDAYNEIRSQLIAQGYESADIDNWDRAREFNRKIALCFALREGSVIREVDQDSIDKVCACLDIFEDIGLVVNGELIYPTAAKSRIGFGDLSRSDDVFSRDMDT